MDPLDAEQEAIDAAVAELPMGLRERFYSESAAAYKDPDTYSALAYLFVAGLHHFYLNRWGRGAIDLSFNFAGLLIGGYGIMRNHWPTIIFGGVIVVGMAISELSYLFRSQSIVKRYNLDRQRDLLATLRGDAHYLPPHP